MRSSWKVNYSLLKNEFYIFKQLKKRKKIKFIFVKRFDLITFKFLNQIVWVHNGRKYKNLKIYKSMLMHKFGEYIFTKKKSNLIHKYIKKK